MRYCLDCEKAKKRAWYEANRERVMAKVKDWSRKNPDKVSAYRRTSRARRIGREQVRIRERVLAGYGMDAEQYAALFQAQGGVCAICKRPEVTGRSMPVDHCHETGEVRGLLCTSCNLGLGRFADDPVRLRAAADYLERAAIAVVRQDPTCP
ncbi:endonuclease VII domain-containing protein [Streptomyces sp. NBC_00996]|uniref:endonuclease VII domain-containing protein n=1 Tax=Streptomyces sp. NBC_00996 TaxID=2903710 RepID=UPI00386E6D15|nr:endonuclease VII domain-containing protein [Streptomyces sp. NBC_00996]